MHLSLYVFLRLLNFSLFRAAHAFQGQVCPLEFSVVCVSLTVPRWYHSAGSFVFSASCEMVAKAEGSNSCLIFVWQECSVGGGVVFKPVFVRLCTPRPTHPCAHVVCLSAHSPSPPIPPGPLHSFFWVVSPGGLSAPRALLPSLSGGSGRPECLRSNYFGALLESSKPKPVVSPSQS